MGCIKCDTVFKENETRYVCDCGGLLDIKYDYDRLNIDLLQIKKRPLKVWRYRELMPLKKGSKIVSLNEGGTTLYPCKNLAKNLGLKHLFVKNEGENPTGSFKDRGMTLGISKAIELGKRIVACASTGNTSASLAAYSAKAGIRCIVLVPSKATALGKLSQALIFGAKVLAVEGNFDQAMSVVEELATRGLVYLLNSINPYRLEGQRTLGFEIVDQLGISPDRIVMPVGNAGNISAVWKAMKEYETLGEIKSLPKMCGIQAAGAAPIVKMYETGAEELVPVENPETIATAIRIGNPVSWPKAIKAIRESRGTALTVTDKEIVEAQKLLARTEGIFVEPASASSIAGLKKLIERREIDRDEYIVCITTGTGLKDPDTPIKSCKDEIIQVSINIEEITHKILGEKYEEKPQIAVSN